MLQNYLGCPNDLASYEIEWHRNVLFIFIFFRLMPNSGKAHMTTMAQMTHFSFPYYFTIPISEFQIPKFALQISKFGIRNCEV